MAASFSELSTAQTKDDILAKLIVFMRLAGFNPTSWQPGSLPRTLLEAEAEYLEDQSASIAQIAKGGFPHLAEEAGDDFVDQVGEGFYDLTRNEAVFTQGMIVLTDSAGVGPVTIGAGDVWVGDATRAYRYNNLTGGTLPLNGTLTLEFKAESAGSAYNLGNGAITELLTSMPGVTVTNPVRGVLPWLTVQGANREASSAYVLRMLARWATLGTGSNDSAYIYYATTASAEVTRAAVSENQITGEVTVTVAGASGPISSDALTDVDTLLQSKRPLGVTVNTQNATASNTLVAGTVFVSPSYDITATVANVNAAVSLYAQTAAIGGTIYRSQLIETMMSVSGVYNINLSAPGGDTVLAAASVFVPTLSLVGSR